MNIFLWTLQVAIALIMLVTGMMKLFNNNEQLKAKGNGRMDWVEDLSDRNVTMIGFAEVLAALV